MILSQSNSVRFRANAMCVQNLINHKRSQLCVTLYMYVITIQSLNLNRWSTTYWGISVRSFTVPWPGVSCGTCVLQVKPTAGYHHASLKNVASSKQSQEKKSQGWGIRFGTVTPFDYTNTCHFMFTWKTSFFFFFFFKSWIKTTTMIITIPTNHQRIHNICLHLKYSDNLTEMF